MSASERREIGSVSLRDYFAASALPALITSNALLIAHGHGHHVEPNPVDEAYRLADEALTVRARRAV